VVLLSVLQECDVQSILILLYITVHCTAPKEGRLCGRYGEGRCLYVPELGGLSVAWY